LELLPEQSAAGGPFQRLASEVSLQTGDPEQALKRAENAVTQDPKDYRNHLWLGQMYWAAARGESAPGRLKKAEACLHQAVELAKTVPDPWVALVQFLARTGKKDQANETIREAARTIAPDQAELAQAQCHEAVGETTKARMLYENARSQKPQDAVVLRGLV